MTTLNTNTNLTVRGHHVPKVRNVAVTQVWHLIEAFKAIPARFRADPEQILAKSARREAARRAVDNLLR